MLHRRQAIPGTPHESAPCVACLSEQQADKRIVGVSPQWNGECNRLQRAHSSGPSTLKAPMNFMDVSGARRPFPGRRSVPEGDEMICGECSMPVLDTEQQRRLKRCSGATSPNPTGQPRDCPAFMFFGHLLQFFCRLKKESFSDVAFKSIERKEFVDANSYTDQQYGRVMSRSGALFPWMATSLFPCRDTGCADPRTAEKKDSRS